MNCSFGYVLYDSAIFAAMYNYPGLIVCGAGNDGSNNDTTPFYPASFDLDNIISVGAIDINNNKWTYSNHGKTSVDVFAPGVDIKSTSKNNTYKVDSGTSMLLLLYLVWQHYCFLLRNTLRLVVLLLMK